MLLFAVVVLVFFSSGLTGGGMAPVPLSDGFDGFCMVFPSSAAVFMLSSVLTVGQLFL